MKLGKIITPPDILVETHELAVANILARHGFDVEFIIPSQIQGVKKPDIILNSREWEIKSPRGKSSRTIENNLRSAVRQSHYIVINLQRMQWPDDKSLTEIKRQFKLSKKIKQIKVITRDQKIIDIE